MISLVSSLCVIAVLVLGILITANVMDLERLMIVCRKALVIVIFLLIFTCALREFIRARVPEIKALLVWIVTMAILMILALIGIGVGLVFVRWSRAKARGKGEQA